VHPDAGQFGFQLGTALCGQLRLARQEHQAGGEGRAHRDLRLARQRAQKRFGPADQQAAAIAGQAIGGHATAVGHARQRGDGSINELARWLIVQLRDHAETAGVAFVVGVVQPLAGAGGHGATSKQGG